MSLASGGLRCRSGRFLLSLQYAGLRLPPNREGAARRDGDTSWHGFHTIGMGCHGKLLVFSGVSLVRGVLIVCAKLPIEKDTARRTRDERKVAYQSRTKERLR